MKFFYILLLSFLTLQCLRVTLAAAACHKDDEAGLLAFKSGITQDPMGMLDSWKPGTNCCDWRGVACVEKNRVTILALYPNKWVPDESLTTGTISPALAKLQYLSDFWIVNLNITGGFPDFLFRLPKIKSVDLSDCKLSGQLPTNLGKLATLDRLSLEGNHFTGSIPSSISTLTRLDDLRLSRNALTGTIPYGISKLVNLSFLDLNDNQLSGTIPDFFVPFTKLGFLYLSGNKLEGPIPPSLASQTQNIYFLNLSRNALTGKIPDFLGKYNSLTLLDLSWNKLTGPVPPNFANLSSLRTLHLSHNYLEDPFPTLDAPSLESLHLSYNNFHLGKMPSWVSFPIRSLNLAKCGIKMNLDDWDIREADAVQYSYVDLSNNEITGSAVSFLNKTEYLRAFWIAGNKLKFDLGSLKIPSTLTRLDLSRNWIFGKVPEAVTGLQQLNVSYNHLCGKLPATKFPASAFVGNDCLCGPPLPPCK